MLRPFFPPRKHLFSHVLSLKREKEIKYLRKKKSVLKPKLNYFFFIALSLSLLLPLLRILPAIRVKRNVISQKLGYFNEWNFNTPAIKPLASNVNRIKLRCEEKKKASRISHM
jgi:hypothetical protein